MEKYAGDDSASPFGASRGDNMYDHCGTTACSVILTNNKIICGNLGDSRAVLAIEKNGKLMA